MMALKKGTRLLFSKRRVAVVLLAAFFFVNFGGEIAHRFGHHLLENNHSHTLSCLFSNAGADEYQHSATKEIKGDNCEFFKIFTQTSKSIILNSHFETTNLTTQISETITEQIASIDSFILSFLARGPPLQSLASY